MKNRIDGLREAEDEVNTIFTVEEGPLVRCVLIKHGKDRSTVLLTIHHSIGDGKAGAFLMRDLFRAASLAQKGEDPLLPVMPPRKEMTTHFPPWTRGISGRWRYTGFILRILIAIIRWGYPAIPRIDRKAPVRKRRACIVARVLDARTVRKLHERARREKTTLHGALLASQILTIASDMKSDKQRPFIIGSPVNLRSRLKPAINDDVGLFATIGISINRVGPSEAFWQLARDVRQSLWECVDRGDPFLYVMLHHDLSTIASIFGAGRFGARIYSYFAGISHLGGIAFSNIGRVEIEAEYGSFTVESLGFAASGSGLCVLVPFVATIERQTTWNFVGMEPLISRAHTERIADKAVEILTGAI